MTTLRCLATLALIATGAAATAETSPYYLGISQGFSHDSNVYRVEDSTVLPAGLNRSDTIASTALVGGIDQPIGRQRLFGNGTFRHNRFADNKALNNESYSANLGLDWETVNHLSGRLSGAASQNLARFNPDNDVPTVLAKNVERTKQLDAVGRLGVVTRLTAELGFGWREVSYSADEFRSREYDQKVGSAGLKYSPSAALTFGTALRRTDGKFGRYRAVGTGFLADRYKRNDLDLTSTWLPSGASTLQARISFTEVDHTEAVQRDYSGATGMVRWNWKPTGKLSFNTILSRDTGEEVAFLDFGGGATGSDGLSKTTSTLRLRADYALTAKITLGAGGSYARRTLVDTFTFGNGSSFPREGRDTTSNVSLNASWAPARSLLLSCEASRDRRSAAGALSDSFGITVYGCTGQFVLQ